MTALAIHKVTELPEPVTPNSLFLIRKGGYLNIACSSNPGEGGSVGVASLNIEEHYISVGSQESQMFNVKTLHVNCYATNGKLTGRTSHISNGSDVINMFCNGYKLSVDSITPDESTPGVNNITFNTDDETLNDVYVTVTIFAGTIT